MSEYKRFVSYLYEYKNNNKAQNCGFCRVELRDHICRLEVHLKLPVYPFTPTLKIYIFVPNEEKLYGIFLGNASYQQGNVSGIFHFSERNIQDSTYHFSDVGGILIQTDTGLYFGSAWKDLMIRPENFVLYQKTTFRKIPDSTEPKLPLPNPEMEASLDETLCEQHQPNTETTSAISTSPENISDSKTPAEFEITQESSIESETPPNSTYTPEPEILAASMDSESTAASPQPNNFWEAILKSYPQHQPFFDDEIHNCVQLSPKDVQKINASGYAIGNNAFFRHNCQSFQHFLLGKKESDGKQQYILAVPGIYNPKEQYMASMFGFPFFKIAQNSHLRNNSWGYWYRIIPEHWNDCCV